MQEEPEAVEHIIKYRTMTQFGAMTLQDMRNEEFLDIMTLNLCADLESKARDNQGKIVAGYQEMGVTPLH